MDMSDKRVKHRLTDGESFALTPAFSADGNNIYFVGLAKNRQFRLMQIPTHGRTPSPVKIKSWVYGAPTGTLDVSILDEDKAPIAARVSIIAANGHPVANPMGATYVDPQTGRSYFYMDGLIDLTLPTGKYQVLAARDPVTDIYSTDVKIKIQQFKYIPFAIMGQRRRRLCFSRFSCAFKWRWSPSC